MSSKFQLKRFISEPISVIFFTPPTHIKSPPCPDQFVWHDKTYHITACIAEGKNFTRRGRMAKNMQPQHAQVAKQRGSWGVGKFFFDVQTSEETYYRIYYDRAPKDATDREGHWVLLAELSKD
jgi:hypothetical protein